MRPQSIQLWIVLTLLVLSVACSLVALWARNGARIRGEQKPFEYSFFIFLLWPVALPYHLIKNRGIDGLIMFIGFLAIHELPSVVALFAYAYTLS